MSALKGFVGPSYVSQSVLADGEDTINFYTETTGTAAAVSPMALCPCPGQTTYVTLPKAPVRAIFGQSGRAYAVGGTDLYSVVEPGVATSLGTMLADQMPATMTTNGDGGDELFICSGTKGYILNQTTNVLTNVVSDVTMGAMLDGYFLALDVTSSTLKISDLLDGLTWDPTQIAQRSTASDPWKSLLVVGKNIWLFGEYTSELWFDSGDNPFPFAPFPGALIQTGIGGSFAAAQVGSNVIWLAQNAQGSRTVVKAQGITAQKISTYAIDYFLSQMTTVSDCEAWVYQEAGHTHCVFDFPSENKTLVWDDTEGQWHKRGEWNPALNRYDVGRARCHAAIFDLHLVGDRRTGAIYTQSIQVSTIPDGSGIRRYRRTPGIQDEQASQNIDTLRLFVETGLGLDGLATTQGSDPSVTMRYSNDGGRTWSNELARSAGKIGEYKQIIDFNRLGQSRYPRVWEVVTSDPIPWRLMGAWVNPPRIGRVG